MSLSRELVLRGLLQDRPAGDFISFLRDMSGTRAQHFGA